MLRGIGMCNRFQVEMGVQEVVVVVVLVVVETQGAKRKTKAGKLPQFTTCCAVETQREKGSERAKKG